MKKKLQLKWSLTILLELFALATYSQDFGNALHFDGTNDYVELNHFARPDNFTIEFWMNEDNDYSLASYKYNILTWHGPQEAPELNFFTEILLNQSSIWYVAGDNTDYVGMYRGGIVGRWHHVAYVKNGDNVKVYLDGKFQKETSNIASYSDDFSKVLILGAFRYDGSTTTTQHFKGAIDELRVWDYPKTEFEIQAQMNKELTGSEGNYGNLSAYFKFNQGDAGADNSAITTLINEVGSDNNTLENFSLGNGNETSNFIESLTESDVAELELDIHNDNALDFDGVNDHIDLEHFEVPDEFTVEFWMRDKTSTLTSPHFTRRHIVSWYDSTDGNNGTEIVLETFSNGSTAVRYAAWSSNSGGYRTIDASITNNDEWYHVAVVREGTSIIIYIDGEPITNGTANYTLDETDKLRIGEWAGGNNNFFGALDELRFWNYAKSQEEIQNLMLIKAVNNETNLLAYYPFNQGSTNDDNTDERFLFDYSGNNYHGTLTDFALTGTTSNWIDGIDVSILPDGAFITTWEVNAGESITIPINGAYNYDFTVDWGDGNTTSITTNDPTDADLSHTYISGDIYTVTITGIFPAIYFNNNSADKDKILTVEQWGNIRWLWMGDAFEGCRNIDVHAPDAPNLYNVTHMWGMFRGASEFTGQHTDLNSWDVSNVQQFATLFGNSKLNASLSDWNIQSAVGGFSDIFSNTSMDCSNTAATLEGWGNNIEIVSGNFELNIGDYAASAETAVSNLEAKGWTINGTQISNAACNSSLSVNNEVFSKSLRVNNPVTQVLTIQGPAGFELKEATVYTMLGKQILNSSSINVNIGSLSSGMYILKIENTEGLIATKKIIKK